jgi:hypothetical protein
MSCKRPALSRSSLQIERLPVKLASDERLVITRPFFVGGESRIRAVIDRILSLGQEDAERILAHVLTGFRHRHERIEDVFEEHCQMALDVAQRRDGFTKAQRLLVGSYFTMEYSVASTAMFNPSMVPHPDQSGVPVGAKRFIMSLRATGEGHISSIVFRTGMIHADRTIHVDVPGPFSRRATLSPDAQYEKALFQRKLNDMAINKAAVQDVLNRLPDHFTFGELDHAIDAARACDREMFQFEETADGMRWLARENYQLEMPKDADISEIVIFPQSENESRGIEDLRLVPFVDDDGSLTYFGTYSAYNGYCSLPQLMVTADFHRIGIHTLNGECAQGKGMALFPRRIDGHYAMCSRIDGENLYIMYSDFVQFWETAKLLQTPKHPWEFTQVGNCGSPL